jgi:hypothetical protein
MADLQGGQTFLNVLPSMAGYFKRVRAAIKSHPVTHEIDVQVDQRRLAKAKADLDSATKGAADARRREAAATNETVAAERQLQALRTKGVTDASRLAAAEDKVVKAKRNSRSAADALNAAELKRSTASTRVTRIETRIDSKRAEADSASLMQRLSTSFGQGGRTVGSKFVSGVSASMNSRSRGKEEGRSFAAGFVSAIGSGMRLAAVGFMVANDAARSVIKNIGMAATGIGLAARMLKHFSAGLLVSTSLLKMMTGAGVAKLAGLLRLAAAAAGILARDIGRVTAALLVMAAAARLVGILTRIGRALGMVTVGSAVALGAFAALGNVVTSFATGPLVAGLTAVAAAMGTVAAAAAGILGPAIGVAKMAFAGLSDGAKAWDKAQKATDSSAAKSASAMKAVENAKKSQARTTEQGARQIVDAEKRVVKAQDDVKEATDGVTKARKEAKREAEGYARTIAGLARDEEGATIALAEAKKNLKETKGNRDSDKLDLWRAEFGVREAAAALEEIKISNEEQRAEIADAQAKGIEGSDRVVDAKKREVDAQEQLRESQADLAQTQKDVAQANIDAAEAVADAYQSMAEAQQSAASDDPFADMIGQRLAPLLQAFKGLREEVTDRFSTAMVGSFTKLGGLMDRLKPKLGGLATTLGNVGTQIVQSISSPAAIAGWDRMIDGSNRFFGSLAQGENGLGSVFSGLISVLGTAAETFSSTGEGLNEWLLSIGEKLRNISADDLRDTFDSVRQVFENISSVVGPLFSLFRGFGAEAASGLAPGFSAMGDAIRDATPGLMDMARELMPALGEALANLSPILPGLVDAFRPWADVLSAVAPHVATIVEKLVPLAPLLLGVVMAIKVIGAAITAWNAVMALASVAQGVFAAAMGLSSASLGTNTIALTAYRVAMIVGTVATWAFNAALAVLTSPITLIIVAIAALVAALIWFFTQTELGKKILDAVWNGIKVGLQSVGDFFVWVWNSLIKPAWDKLGEGISWVWENVIKKAWDALTGALQAVGDFFKWIWETLIKPAWDKLGNGINWVWENVIQKAFNGIKSGLGFVRDAFDSAVKFIEKVWDGVRAAVAKPIKFVIDSVYNNGIREAWNKVAGFVGLGKLDEYKPDWLGSYASGTSVLPGYSPGVDNMRFVSTDGRAAIDLGGGESILRPEVTRAVGPGWVDGVNAAAASGGTGGVQRYLGGFASGGIVESIVSIANEHFPGLSVTSSYRDSNDLHGQGKAVDLSNQVAGGPSTPLMQEAARFFYENYGPNLAELIHWPLNGWENIDEGRPYDFGAATNAQHVDHLHVAAHQPLGDPDGSGGNLLSRAWGAVTGTIGRGLRWTVEKLFNAVMDPIGNAIPDFGGSTIGQFPRSAFNMLKDKAKEFLLGKADEKGSSFSAGAGAEQWRSMMIEAYRNQGYDPTPAKIDAWVRQIHTESGGDPNIAQQIVDVNGTGEAAGVGLGQMIPGTWQAYRDPSLPDDRRDPWAMTNAMVRYGERRYGDSLLDVIGHGHGYDRGGIANGIGLMPKMTLEPERVLSPRQTAAWESLVPHLVGAESAMGLLGGTGRMLTGLSWEQIMALRDLFETGDYTSALSNLGIEEDSPYVDAVLTARANLDEAHTYAGEIDWGGVGSQIGSSLLAEWGNDLLGIAGLSGQFEGLKLVDDTGRGRSDEDYGRNEASFNGAPTPGTQAAGGDPEANTERPESLVEVVKRLLSPQSVYDQGGIASGKGYLLKDVIHPERVLSPRQTEAFEQLVPMLDRMQQSTTAPADVMPASALSSLEYAPVGAGGDTFNVYGKADRGTMNEVGIFSNQRTRSRRYDGGQR